MALISGFEEVSGLTKWDVCNTKRVVAKSYCTDQWFYFHDHIRRCLLISIPYKERSSTIELLCSANNQTVVARSLTVPYRLRYLSYFIFCSIAVISCALAIQPILRRTCARGMSYQFLRLRTKWGRSDIRIRIYVCVKSCAAAASCCQAVAKKDETTSFRFVSPSICRGEYEKLCKLLFTSVKSSLQVVTFTISNFEWVRNVQSFDFLFYITY
jgi:hypothetical protein